MSPSVVPSVFRPTWHHRLVAKKIDGSKKRKYLGGLREEYGTSAASCDRERDIYEIEAFLAGSLASENDVANDRSLHDGADIKRRPATPADLATKSQWRAIVMNAVMNVTSIGMHGLPKHRWHLSHCLIVFALAMGVVSCTGQARQMDSAASERPATKKQTGYIRTNDNVRIYYERAGSGKNIVLIPGAGCSIDWWRRNFDALSEQFHVVAVDMRGTGRSQKCDWGHNCARYAMDVYALIHALEMDDVTLVGWSCGARTSYSYPMLFGNHRLRGVVVVDDTVHHTVHAPATEDAKRKPGESDVEFTRRLIRRIVSPAASDAGSEKELEWMTGAFTFSPAPLAADGQAQDWRPLCPVIDVPVLITSGRHSGALPGCRYAAEHIPEARLEIFEQSGHALFYTEAERFNQLVAEFVDHPE